MPEPRTEELPLPQPHYSWDPAFIEKATPAQRDKILKIRRKKLGEALTFITEKASLNHLDVLTNPSEAARAQKMRDILNAAKASGGAALKEEQANLELVETLRSAILHAAPDEPREKRGLTALGRLHPFVTDLARGTPKYTMRDVFTATGQTARELFDSTLLVDPSAYVIHPEGKGDYIIKPLYATEKLDVPPKVLPALQKFLESTGFSLSIEMANKQTDAAKAAFQEAKDRLTRVKRDGEAWEGERVNAERELESRERDASAAETLPDVVRKLAKKLDANKNLRLTQAPIQDPGSHELALVDLGKSLVSGAHIVLEPLPVAASTHGTTRGLSIVSLLASEQGSSLSKFVLDRAEGKGPAFGVVEFTGRTWHEKPLAVTSMNKGKFYLMKDAVKDKPALAFALYLKFPNNPNHVTPDKGNWAEYEHLLNKLGYNPTNPAQLEYIHQKVPHPREGFEALAMTALELAHRYAKAGRLFPK